MTDNKVREVKQPKHIKLPCFGIEVWVGDPSDTVTGRLTSDLRSGHECPDKPFAAAMIAIESMVLGHALADIDIESPAYLEGIESAVDTICSRYDH